MFGGADPVVVLITLSMLALAPFVAIMVTSFTKIVIVMSLVRNALGMQQIPPNLVMNGLAIILTMYIMAPIGGQIAGVAERTLMGGGNVRATNVFDIMSSAKEPLRAFLIKHAHPREREFFLKSAATLWPPEQAKNLKDDDLMVLVPAFTVSELTAAFKIGFLVYLGFVVIDLVVANILVALGMMMFSPTVVAVPLKLLLFVMLDGWGKLIHGLVLTYR